MYGDTRPPEPTVVYCAQSLLDALFRMAKREHLSMNVRHWESELYAALEREDSAAATGTAA